MILEGRVWKFGDNLRSTYFFNGKYDLLGRKKQYSELATHILEDECEGFAEEIREGDIFVVGESFGTGKHLWGPVGAFRALGIQAVIGKSFSTSWQRNSLNVGYPSLVCPEIWDLVVTGDSLRYDLASGDALNITQNERVSTSPVPAGILEMVDSGGIAGLTSLRLGLEAAAAAPPN